MDVEDHISKSVRHRAPIADKPILTRSMRANPRLPEIMTTYEAGQFLNVTDRAIWRWRKYYGMPSSKVGKGANGKVFILRSRLLEWLLSHEEKHGDQGSAGQGQKVGAMTKLPPSEH